LFKSRQGKVVIQSTIDSDGCAADNQPSNPLLLLDPFPTMKEIHSLAIEAVLEKTDGNRSQSSRILDVSRSTIQNYLNSKE